VRTVSSRRLIIGQHLIQRILEHCLEEKPCEACGILTGRNGRVLHAYATDNVKRSPVYYEVDPEQQQWVLTTMEEQGEELVAIYHSHPTAAAVPSANDIRLAVHYPEAVRVIVSLAGPAVVKAFLIQNGKVLNVELDSPHSAGGVFHDLRGRGSSQKQKA
jgi:[CysO sulfur-carrier protein]-S-L-cysteine hydrolase